jgi:hypothetical protein
MVSSAHAIVDDMLLRAGEGSALKTLRVPWNSREAKLQSIPIGFQVSRDRFRCASCNTP